MEPAALALNVGLTAAVLVAAWFGVRVVRRLVEAAARRLPGPQVAEKRVRTARAARFSMTVFRLLVAVGAAVAIAALWGFDLPGWLSRGLGRELAQTVLRTGLLLVVAVFAIELSAFLINHSVARLIARANEPRRAAQLRTLGPLLRGAAKGAIAILVVLTVLGDLGVRIGPLLAGAGVVGVALGFGAQTIVKDLLTGLFLVVEDIVAVGDIVRIGDSSGLVEKMTQRTIHLRDFDGTLHVVPYGEAQVVHNLTKTFSYYVFDLQVSYGSDIDRALEVMNRVGAEMQADPEYADKILEPIEVVGVEALADSGVALKARIKTMPIEQWTVGREYNRRIKLAFDAAGIEIPFPHLKLVLPEGQTADVARRLARAT